MKKVLRVLLPALIFLLGFAVLFYPVFSDLWNQHRQNSLISSYDNTVAALPEETTSELLEQARAYNAGLDKAFHDAFTGDTLPPDDVYWSLLDPDGSGIMGYLEIPKISLRLPIYHGTSEASLQRGVGHLAGTSLPVGGEGTHSVLSAHRGLPSALLFTDLDQLQVGDQFYITVVGEKLAYAVDQILVVEPDQVSALTADDSGDYVTLLTCTPYGVNTHRLLVRGSRTALDEQEDSTVTALQQTVHSFGWKGKLLLALLALLIAAALVAIVRRKKKKSDRKN